MRVLIVGGYGTFGGRLVRLLEDDASLTLLVAGRSLGAAAGFCALRTRARGGAGSGATLQPVSYDRSTASAQNLRELTPDLVVDASGPFQVYGTRPYALVEHCIECRIPYLDLADGADFVGGIAKYDAAARAAGVFILSGVSSFPVLSAAVVRRLATGAARLRTVRGGVAPSPYAGVGLNVIRALASYAGKPVALRRGGRTSVGQALTESRAFTIAVPGRVPLGRRRFSLVEVPDLQALAERWPDLEETWMGGAPVPAILHRLFTLLAWLVRLRLLPGLAGMAPMFHWVLSRARWGEHRGGMLIEVSGRDAAGAPFIREWHLTAERDDGPFIPSMGAAALVRRCQSGIAPRPGARAGIDDVELEEYEAAFVRREIHTGVRERADESARPLFERLLGSAWHELAPEVRTLHSFSTVAMFSGRCSVRRGSSMLSRLMAAVAGFPRASPDHAIEVTMMRLGEGERWIRRFGDARLESRLLPGRGSSEWLLRERLGPVSVDMALLVQGDRLRYRVRRWAFLGIPMPPSLGPRTESVESVRSGRFHFDVEVTHPWAGLIVRYYGTLMPHPAAIAASPVTASPPRPYSYRDDPSVPLFPDDRPIIVFDGLCVLCSGSAQFIMRHDRLHTFRLLAAQSPLGTALYRHLGLDTVRFESFVYLERGRAWLKSDAAVRIARGLDFPWSLLRFAAACPRRLRDALYDWVARHRLRWFGTRAECFVPRDGDRERFLG